MEKTDKKKSSINEQTCEHCGEVEDPKNKMKSCSRCLLVSYCNVACQTAHWKNGHKQLCIQVIDRKPSTSLSDTKETTNDGTRCVICLYSDSVTMPCDHTFHAKCVVDLRAASLKPSCPLCRTNIPPGPEKAYIEAQRIFYKYEQLKSAGLESTIISREKLVKQFNELWKVASSEGHAKSQYNLGMSYQDGLGVTRNYEKAFELYLKAAKQGLDTAQFNLHGLYAQGHGVKQNDSISFEWCLKSAKQGLGEAQSAIGVIYIEGKGVGKDVKKSLEWFLKAANQGNGNGLYNVGMMYEHGNGVTLDYLEASKWYLKAAEQGNHASQYSLGMMYAKGKKMKRDIKKATYWFMKAALGGDAQAQFNLGHIYGHGFGMMKNEQKAYEWYLKSANQGCMAAQNSLGAMYHNGTGFAGQSDEKGLRYWLLAAQQGHLEAQFYVGVELIRQCRESDSDKHAPKMNTHTLGGKNAMDWIMAAADGGYEKAKKLVDTGFINLGGFKIHVTPLN